MKQILGGELIVIGHDQVEIGLHKLPKKVEVKFKHDQTIIPCSPHDYDSLTYEVLNTYGKKHPFVLKISWKVSANREIVYKAFA